MKKADPHLLVIFGASGDLTRRKLIPALYDLYVKELLPAGFAVVGASRTPFSDEEFRENMRTFLPGTEKTDLFSKMLHYLPFDPEKEEEYHLLRNRLADLGQEKQTGGNLIFYLSTPPSLYGIIPARLHAAGLSRSDRGFRRLIVEKPFGTSLHSARELNVNLLHYFDEEQIFRIEIGRASCRERV